MRERQKHQCCECAELQKILEEKNKEIVQLKNEKIILEYELKEMRDKWFSKKKKKKEKNAEVEAEDENNDAPPKKLGAPPGHPGWYRKTPDHIDETEEVELCQCPHCGGKDLGECSEIEEHIQEDIVLPRVKVTKYRRHYYWCYNCKKKVSGKGQEEIPKSYIGPQAKAVAAFLKYVVKVSTRDIQKIFKELCGLTIVPSSIPGFNNQARIKCAPLYDAILDKIKQALYLHADETGCPVNGKNWWDWIFVTSKLCLHLVHHSRGQQVVEEVLGKKYDGILLSDFLSAYNKIETKAKQRCLVHLLRDLKKILECTDPEDAQYRYCQRLKHVIQQAIELSEKYKAAEVSDQQFAEQKQQIKESIKDFLYPDPQKSHLTRLAKRLNRHQDELFTFLDYPGIPYHNNFAERMIRPSVLLRKITFGLRSDNGILNHSVLMSVLQTGRLNAKNSIKLIKHTFTSRDKPTLDLCHGP